MAAARNGIAMTSMRPAGLGIGALRVVLLAGILAIIAGILGMHVVTATHAGHAPAAAETTIGATSDGASLVAAVPGHSGHQAATAAAPDARSSVYSAPVCSGSGHSGPGTAVMAAGCVLATGNTALAAPLSDATRLVPGNGPPRPGNCTCSSSYVPGSPSPGELSISRT
ncbi:hypothetical protein [Arthrobacter sp. CJ23]|uniref:hypothetical protein n=1 Tax=Arthrobacter sp. CJ23 TaxID=2972479 RepID=UPI00215C5FAA|nr:hypothetical protein [Arthrobacter sp. CJ23]UVJ40207.1 hypothetical protein NVV90_03190 [Arthrobacter sp. CJ23]